MGDGGEGVSIPMFAMQSCKGTSEGGEGSLSPPFAMQSCKRGGHVADAGRLPMRRCSGACVADYCIPALWPVISAVGSLLHKPRNGTRNRARSAICAGCTLVQGVYATGSKKKKMTGMDGNEEEPIALDMRNPVHPVRLGPSCPHYWW